VKTSSRWLKWASCGGAAGRAKLSMYGRKNNAIESGAVRHDENCRFLPDIAGFSATHIRHNPALVYVPDAAAFRRIVVPLTSAYFRGILAKVRDFEKTCCQHGTGWVYSALRFPSGKKRADNIRKNADY
jgi:hypothetical protein